MEDVMKFLRICSLKSFLRTIFFTLCCSTTLLCIMAMHRSKTAMRLLSDHDEKNSISMDFSMATNLMVPKEAMAQVVKERDQLSRLLNSKLEILAELTCRCLKVEVRFFTSKYQGNK